MIVEARYVGPHALVEIPHSGGKRSRRQDDGKHPIVKIRARDGHPLGGCWDITKGKKEYEAGIENLQAEAKKTKKARAKRAAETAAEAERLHDAPSVKPAAKRTSEGKG